MNPDIENSKSTCVQVGGVELCLDESDIVAPKKRISIQKLLDRAKKLSKMQVLSND